MSNADKGSAKKRITEHIQAGMIARRLQDFALSKPSDDNHLEVYMHPHQVTAGCRLLNKTVPDLKQVEQILRDEREKTRLEIFEQLASFGLDPEEIWQSLSKH